MTDQIDQLEERLRKDRGRINCPNGLKNERHGAWCENCGRPIMYVRRSRRARGHWQHVGDGLAQYRSWRP